MHHSSFDICQPDPHWFEVAELFTDAWDLLSGLSLQRMAGTPCQAITTMEAECPGSPPLSHIAGISLDGTETTQGKGHMHGCTYNLIVPA